MPSKRYTLGTFVRGIAGYLDDLGRFLQREKPIHPAFLSNEEINGKKP